MNAYIFQAALLCEDCAMATREQHDSDVPIDDRDDSDNWPQGPYPDGGGEADCPQHCDHCGCFLENPLTSDGVEYVREKLLEHNNLTRRLNSQKPLLHEWSDFYDIHLDSDD